MILVISGRPWACSAKTQVRLFGWWTASVVMGFIRVLRLRRSPSFNAHAATQMEAEATHNVLIGGMGIP